MNLVNAEAEQPNFGANFWQDWEKPIHIEMFETDGSTGFSVDAGVKIFGNWSRANPQKSLAFFTRSKYGSKLIKHQIFKDKPIKEFENIVLRNSGGDFLNANMRDGMISSLVRNMGIDRQAYRPVKVYLNGEYWGTMALREKINEHFIAANHGLNSFEVQTFEWNGAPLNGSNKAYTELISFLKNNNLSDDANYQLVKQKIDIQSFINYYNSEIFIVNEDWPGNNYRMWTSSRADAKIRPILFDTDFGFGTWQVEKFNNDMVSFALATLSENYANSPEATFLLRKLMENNSFKIDFLNSAADRLNTTFCTDSVLIHIDSIHYLIASEIESHNKRWNGDMDYFNANINNIKYFAEQRPEIARSHYETYFNTQGSFNLSLTLSSENAGRISLNSISLNRFPWSGKYFNDIPITLTAIPAPGYRFIRWEGDDNSTNTTITVTNQSANVALHAVFEFDKNLLPK
ncbi:MAG: CotH kinase family protein [Bacteroidales bacterium]|nr:CotH kinase family protein [Bacteroidales bacterium]